MSLKKRQMIYIPEVNPTSFVLFFEKGNTGLSWSIHDYSEWGQSNKKGKWNEKGQYRLYNRTDYKWTAEEVREKAGKDSYDAPPTHTEEYDFWRSSTLEFNKRLPSTIRSAATPVTAYVNRGLNPKQLLDSFKKLSKGFWILSRIAEKIGCDPQTLSRIRNGTNGQQGTLSALATFMKREFPQDFKDLDWIDLRWPEK